MAIQIQLRRDSVANWIATNPVLAEGEIGLETGTWKAKIGDGITNWLDLNYALVSDIADLTDFSGILASKVDSVEIDIIKKLTQAEYDALGVKNPTTLYLIIG